MSDPVTNVEIEDVLASIRRLVSEDVRVRPMAPAAAPAPVVKPVAGRLVLTPALRVMETQKEAEEASAPEAETAVWDNPEARLADVWPEDQPIPAAPEPEAEAHIEVVEEAAESVEEAPFLHVETPPEADVRQWFDADQPEQPAEEAEIAEVAPEGEPEQPVEMHEEPKPSVEEPQETSSGEGMASLEWEDHDEFGPEPHEGEDHLEPSEPEMAEEPAESEIYAASTEAEDEEDAIEDLLSEEAVIDEAALREMVAEIVRQELMGALGERITRNVRKLVCREIHRALSAQDFE